MVRTGAIQAPPLWKTALEARAPVEYAGWTLSQPFLERLRRGDGHPVLVMPGFTAADRSTARLRALLRELDYRTYGWGLGANIGPTPRIVDGIRRRVGTIVEREQRPISIVGWSLGGIFGRVIARERPEEVRQVVTLGSPFRMSPDDKSAASGVWDSLRELHDPVVVELLADKQRGRLPVPTTAVYTRTDGIVHWKACIEEKSPTSESVEVFGSHCGLGFNPAAAYVIADRLAQPDGTWRRFRPPLWALAAFPRPTHHRP